MLLLCSEAKQRISCSCLIDIGQVRIRDGGSVAVPDAGIMGRHNLDPGLVEPALNVLCSSPVYFLFPFMIVDSSRLCSVYSALRYSSVIVTVRLNDRPSGD